MKTKDMTTLHLRKSIGPATAGRGFLLIPLVLACFAFPRAAQAEDGGYPNGNTAEGDSALNAIVTNPANTGSDNTATGLAALFSNTT
jgi:hypothetical protein